jgi:hypothetical protein
MEAAFKPQVNDELDTQNFMKFEEVSEALCNQFFLLFHNSLNCRLVNLQLIILVNKFPLVPTLDSLNCKPCQSTNKYCVWNIASYYR